MTKQLDIVVGGSLRDDAQAFVHTWHRAAAGEDLSERVLSFESWEALAATLTQARVKLLRDLHKRPAVSIRDLAGRLDRPYRRVHDDVMALVGAGLIERQPDRSLTLVVDSVSARVAFG